MKMTPSPTYTKLQKYTETIKSEDIEKFRKRKRQLINIRKGLKSVGKEELDKSVQRMKEEIMVKVVDMRDPTTS